MTLIGVERYLVCSSLRLAVAQRLVRKICPHGRETYKPSKEVLRSLLFSWGKGCRRCRETGYYGRTAICEMLEMKAPLQSGRQSSTGPISRL